MKELLVLGIGNRLMTDDGIGVYVTEELRRGNTNPHIRYIIGETDIYFCLSQMEEALPVVIVDAAYLGKEPGSVSTIPLELGFKNSANPISVHDSHLLCELGSAGRKIEGILISIEPYEVNYGPSLSSVIKLKFTDICKETKALIVEYYFTKKKASHGKQINT